MINLYGKDFFFSVDCEKAVEQLQAELADSKDDVSLLREQNVALQQELSESGGKKVGL